MSYIHMKNCLATDINAQAGHYLHGLPAMTGPAGFVHVTERNFREEIDSNDNLAEPSGEGTGGPIITGFMIAIHSLQVLEGHPKFVKYRHNSISKDRIAAPFVKRKAAHLRFNLFMHVDVDQQAERAVELYIQSGRFGDFLETLRFCGGQLDLRKEPGSGVQYLTDAEDFEEAIAALPRESFIIEDASKDLQEQLTQNPGKDPLDLLLSMISFSKKNKTGKVAKEKSRRPYYIPIAVGYQGLEPAPVSREGTRGGYRHIFAEPVIGLGRARLSGSYLANHKTDKLPVWWNYTSDAGQNLYIVKGHGL